MQAYIGIRACVCGRAYTGVRSRAYTGVRMCVYEVALGLASGRTDHWLCDHRAGKQVILTI